MFFAHLLFMFITDQSLMTKTTIIQNVNIYFIILYDNAVTNISNITYVFFLTFYA